MEDPFDVVGFLWDDLHFFPVDESISEGSLTGNKFSALHAALIAHTLVFGDGDGFLLGQGSGNAHHQF